MYTQEDFVRAALRQTLTQSQVAWFFSEPEDMVKSTLTHLAERCDWAGFGQDFEQMIDKLSSADHAWVQYVQYYICTVNTNTRPWTIRNLSPSAQVRVLKLPDITYLVGEYAEGHDFCERAVEVLLKNTVYFETYVSHRKLDKIGFIKMFASQQCEELLKIYIKHRELSASQEQMMFRKFSVDSPMIIDYVEKHRISPAITKFLLLQLMKDIGALKKQVASEKVQ